MRALAITPDHHHLWFSEETHYVFTDWRYGAGLYGAAMGCWRDPMQALYTAIKFPLIILLTAAGNAMLNAMLAPLLGLNISFRQSFLAILMSFTPDCVSRQSSRCQSNTPRRPPKTVPSRSSPSLPIAATTAHRRCQT